MSLCLVELLTKTTPNTDGRAMLSVLRDFKLKKGSFQSYHWRMHVFFKPMSLLGTLLIKIGSVIRPMLKHTYKHRLPLPFPLASPRSGKKYVWYVQVYGVFKKQEQL